jgi:GDP-4-dehydro-6-deoxy-D-mannose reductase
MADPERILLTGASGFVGHHLIPALRIAFPKSRLIAASESGEVAIADETLPLDLLDRNSIECCVSSARPDRIIHLAARASVSGAFVDPWQTWQINVDGTLRLAHTVGRVAPNALFIFISSAEIYGLTFQHGATLDEDATLAPANPYAASKAAADIALGEMALRGLKLLRLRPVNHTGPGQSDMFVAPAFARQIARIEAGLQEPVLRVGALDRWRDFLDVHDVCAAYVAALSGGLITPQGEAINIASGQPRRIGDILNAMIAYAGITVTIESEPRRMRSTDVLTASCNASRAAKLLGWEPRVPWETTLQSVLDDWRERIAMKSDS